MANFLSQLLNSRFLQPAVEAGVANALSTKQPIAYGVGTVPETSLAQSIGQAHDGDYAIHRANTDVSGRVDKRAVVTCRPLFRPRMMGILPGRPRGLAIN
jgi:hypothetical protein